MAPVKILTFSRLYPQPQRPGYGVFVETRLRQLLKSGMIESKVMSPVPWFPSVNPRFGEYALHAAAPREEIRHGIHVLRPRYPAIPKVGMAVAPFALALAVAPAVSRLIANGYNFDVIDAHYFYPDGVAAALIGERFRKPFVITARGSDLNLLPRYAVPRRLIRWAARRAHAVITVSEALKKTAIDLGIDPEKLTVLRNGVDTDFFRPADRDATRKAHGLSGVVLLSVGNLVPLKSHHLVIEALALLPDAQLLIAGAGAEQPRLQELSTQLGVSARVRFLGPLPQERLIEYYSAADVLVLASFSEGWPNVLLESLACDTPVIASDVGGCAEVVASDEAGVLLQERTPEAIARSVRELVSRNRPPHAARCYAQRFSWTATTNGQLEILSRAARGASSPAPATLSHT